MQAVNPLVRAEVLEERAYQFKIAEEAIKRNTLVVLPTALGKTIIAVLAASHFLYNYSNLKVLVMAPTRPLVLQHRDTFMRLLKLRPQDVQVLTGKYGPSYRLHAWQGPSRIYFATPQVVNNDHGLGMSLKDFSLIVFDECHRARKNYAYTRVAKAYVNEAPYPIILGLTASPGADKERIEEICKALYIERVEVRTEEDADVKPYVSPITIDWKFVRLPESYGPIEDVLRRMLDERLQKLSSMGVVRKNPRYIFKSDLLKAGDEIRRRLEQISSAEERGQLFGVLILQSSSLTLYHALELFGSQGPQTLKLFLDRTKDSGRTSHKAIVSELISTGVFEALESNSLEEHPKVEVLKKLVREQLSLNPSSKIIVFTQYRDTSSHLASELSKLGIVTARFIGQADRELDSGLTQDQQALLLERFRGGDLKVLVATSIGEEGLDIPSVDFVVFYEPVPSEIRYIQRKGRTGRRSFGHVTILAAEGTLDVSYLAASKRMAERMKKVVGGLNDEINPIIRCGSVPEKNSMPMEIISEAEELSHSDPGPTVREHKLDPETKALEKERLLRFNGKVRGAAKRILALTLKAGSKGFSVDDLKVGLDGEEMSPAVVKAAINKLRAENQVRVKGGRILSMGAAMLTPMGKESHVFEVVKVLHGEAVLLVDGKWHAVLTPSEYDGPRQLLRKGSRFKAVSELYRLEGVLHAKIYAIEESLD
ncbi:MAG: helicase-related protein [Methanobacteriota archaeon]